MRRLPLLLLLEFGCAGPDEFSVATYAGQTDYPSRTDIWDSNNWGAEARLAWDIGERQQANRAQVEMLQEMRRREVLRQEYGPQPAEKPVKVERDSNNAEIITALTILISAIAGYRQRHNIARGVKGIHAKVTKKKEPRP